MLINHLISMVCVFVCVITSSSHSANIWGDPIADQLLELVCKLKMVILALTESTVQFVACGCGAIKVLQDRRWPVEAVLHFCVSNLGSCHPCGRWFKRFHQPKHRYTAPTCYGAANGFRTVLRSTTESGWGFPPNSSGHKQNKQKNPHGCRTSTRVTNTAAPLSCCRLGSGASLRCHPCDIYFPAGVCDAVVRWTRACLSARVCVCLR